jgi:hypothetical protein
MNPSCCQSTPFRILQWIARLVAAVIMLQTLYYKFSAAPESVYIFTTVGLEPVGRIGIGTLELIASILILIPAARVAVVGAGLGAGLMAGAIFLHLTKLGVVVMGDGGGLFALAVIVLLGCLAVLVLNLPAVLWWLSLVGIRLGSAASK